MKIKLKIWRQKDKVDKGGFKNYQLDNVNEHMSFLEMLDVLNEDLAHKGEEPVAFSHDCREGICGSCGCVINGRPHGPEHGTATCQLHMRKFNDGDAITVEPWRAKAFPVLKDLVVDRSAFDRIQQSGGYITVNTGSAPEANLTPIAKPIADEAFLAAACIGCGACVAACKNASAMLFVAAKVSHLALVPQGKAERAERVRKMVSAMDAEGFGNCTNTGACEAECPKEISLSHIARMNREYASAELVSQY
ncbi:MAG: succinate dehydrogenase/fumarate reductase iron-sulfur subunit [Spirochaetes bacterium]|nr:succinate dehydrogenase/fumarate reductase iron-sulfur subunit [Spirochaetota bacterium]